MRRITTILAITALALFTTNVMAQSTENIIKERQEIKKASKSELNEKASKAARKEAKRLKKEGWQVAPGALPLDKQLDRAYNMQYEYDEYLFPKYVMGEAMSTGQNYDAAKIQAIELAKQSLAGQIQTEITALVENSVANDQLGAGEATSVTKSILAAKNLITQSIGKVITVVECYRDLDNGNREVRVQIAYNSDMAKAAAKKAAQKELEQESEDLQKKLDEVLGW